MNDALPDVDSLVEVGNDDDSQPKSQPETPTMEASVLELYKPRMKIFHGTTGLRVRSSPSLNVSSSFPMSCHCWTILIIIYIYLKSKKTLGVIKPGNYFAYIEEVS